MWILEKIYLTFLCFIFLINEKLLTKLLAQNQYVNTGYLAFIQSFKNSKLYKNTIFFPPAFSPWWICWDSPSNWWHHLILFPGFSSKGDTQVISSFHLPLLQLTLGAHTHSNNLQRQFHNLHLGIMFCCCYLPSKIW